MWQTVKNQYHLLVAVLANVVYGSSAKSLKVIGVTGTDGKTTTVSLIYHILETSGHRASMIASTGATINGKAYDTGFHVTTPSSLSIQKFLKKALDGKCEYFVLEVTSHSIDQNRVYGIPFRIAVLTNVTHEHLDYHKTYENYLNTKLRFVISADTCIVNRDDASFSSFSRLQSKNPNKKYISYGLSEISNVNPGNFDISSFSLKGEFNKYNLLAAVAVARNLGISDSKIIRAVNSFKFPAGRMETVYDKDFKVIIDFAHTPNSFKNVLNFVRPLTEGRIIHVFGSAGQRDKSKRPDLGKISSEFADLLILTSEDPRRENAERIVKDIEKGIADKSKVIRVLDREKAIEKAVEEAKKGDLILITGKAQESSMNYGSGEKPWDEFKAVKSALEKYNFI